MASVSVVKRVAKVVVTLSGEEYEALAAFVRSYGSTYPRDFDKWRTGDGGMLWSEAHHVVRKVKNLMPGDAE